MASAQPKVSVIICTYNAGDYLIESIGSALNQTLRDLEIIVLDNASTDHTPQLVQQFTDSRFRYIRNERNLGFVGNVNKGLEIAAGEYVTFLGADDVWEPDYLSRAITLLHDHPSAVLAHGVVSLIDSAGRQYGYAHQQWENVTPGKRAFLNCFLYGFTFASVIVKTDHLKQIGPFNTSWNDIADSWLFLTMCLEGDVVCVTEPLVRYRVHDQSISLSMYRSNEMFRQHIRVAREALAWPKAIASGVDQYRGQILRCIAHESMQMIHLCRLTESRVAFLKMWVQIVREVPGVLILLSTWLRLALGMLPRSVIQHLRQRRRSEALQEHGLTSSPEASQSPAHAGAMR